MSKKLKAYIPKDIQIVGGEENEEVKDDIHMILEYKADEEFGALKAPRANRYIVHNDENNPLLSSLEKFDEYLPGFNPNLLVISGLQMMDNYPFKIGDGKGMFLYFFMLFKNQSYNTNNNIVSLYFFCTVSAKKVTSLDLHYSHSVLLYNAPNLTDT